MLAHRERLFIDDLDSAIRLQCGREPCRLANGLVVQPSGPEGFGLTVIADAGRYALYFDGWAEEFGSDEIVRRLVLAALSGDVRLRVDLLGGRRWRWTLESLDANGAWQPESTLSHVTWRFWGARETQYLRNAPGPAARLDVASRPAADLLSPPSRGVFEQSATAPAA